MKQIEKKVITTIDIEKQVVTASGTAYYRLPKEVKEFFELCEKKQGIVGFEWEVGSYNFGVILEDKLTKKK